MKQPSGTPPAEFRDRLRAAGLTPRQTVCLALWSFDGMSTREIAQQLEMSHQVVCRHVQAAKSKLARAGLELRPLTVEPGPREFLTPDVGDDEIRGMW